MAPNSYLGEKRLTHTITAFYSDLDLKSASRLSDQSEDYSVIGLSRISYLHRGCYRPSFRITKYVSCASRIPRAYDYTGSVTTDPVVEQFPQIY